MHMGYNHAQVYTGCTKGNPPTLLETRISISASWYLGYLSQYLQISGSRTRKDAPKECLTKFVTEELSD